MSGIVILASFYYTLALGVEITFFCPLGIQLVSLDERTDKPYSKIFFIFFSMNVNILSYVDSEFLVSRLFCLSCFSGSLLGHWVQ